MVSYEVTFYTGDVPEAGTDSQVFIKVFGVKGSSSDIYIDKMTERFERGKIDLVKVVVHNLYVGVKLRDNCAVAKQTKLKTRKHSDNVNLGEG